MGLSESDKDGVIHWNARIVAARDLILSVEGHADLQGVYISAKSLEAAFDSLVLASAVDHVEESGMEARANIDIANWKQSVVGGGRQAATQHVVGEVTALLGAAQAKVVVRRSLRLVGAMVANAEIGEDGRYTDHGNLQLKVGELYIEHLRLYDNGRIYGGAVQLGVFENGEIAAKYAGHKQEGAANATIGRGNIEVRDELKGDVKNGLNNSGGGGLSGVNRDVNNAHKMGKKHVIRPIEFTYNNFDREKLQREVAARGGMIESLKQTAGALFGQAGDMIRGAFGGKRLELEGRQNHELDDGGVGEYDEYNADAAGGSYYDNDEISQYGDDTAIREVEGLPWLNKAETQQIIDEINKYVEKSPGNDDLSQEKTKLQINNAVIASIMTNNEAAYDLLLDEGPAIHTAPSFGKAGAQKIMRVMQWYAEFAQEYPLLAEYGARAASALIQTIAGGHVGFGNFVRTEVQSQDFTAVTGEQVDHLIQKSIDGMSLLAKNRWSDITREEAEAWGTAAVLGGLFVAHGVGPVSKVVRDFAQKLRSKSIGMRPIEWDKQGKHMPEHKNYIASRGIISIKKDELEKLVKTKIGTGQAIQGTRGKAGYRERVDFGTEIGMFVEEKTGNTFKTTKGIIHYSNRGIHVTPARP